MIPDQAEALQQTCFIPLDPYQDTVRERPVVKAVRYGITFLALPSAEAVGLVERVIAKQRDHPYEPKTPFWAE